MNSNNKIGFCFTSANCNRPLDGEVGDTKVHGQNRLSTFNYIKSWFGRRDIGALLRLKNWIIANQGSVV